MGESKSIRLVIMALGATKRTTRNMFKTKLWRSEHRGEAEEGGEKRKGKSKGGK